MKKVLLFASVVGLFAMTSCKKCGKCVVNGVEGTEICKDDVGQVGYDVAKNACAGTWED